MKLRAPRCNDSMSATLLPACQSSQRTGAAAAGSPAAGSAADSPSGTASTVRTKAASLAMERDSLGHGFDRIDARIERHQPEVGEVRNRKDARHGDVGLLRRL